MAESGSAGPGHDRLVSRADAERVFRRAGLSAEQIASALDDIEFPAPLSRVRQHAAWHGITVEQLMDRMGGSR